MCFSKSILENNVLNILQSTLKPEGFVLENPVNLRIKDKIDIKGKPLKNWNISINYGFRTGYNKAFLINGSKRKELIEKDKNSAKIIKPLLRGRDIKRYSKIFKDIWIIISKHNGHKELFDNYPTIVEHLKLYEKELKNRGQVRNGQHHWIELDNGPTDDYLELFQKEKIIWIVLSDVNKFYLDKEKYYSNDSTFFMTGQNLKYLTAFLNSKLCLWYFNIITPSSGMGTTMWKKTYIEEIPIIEIDDSIDSLFHKIVEYIIYLKGNDQNSSYSIFFEKIIDGIFFELYFEDDVKKIGREILRYLDNLLPIEVDMSDEEKMNIITQAYNDLSNPNHPVCKNLKGLDEIKEVRIIKGLE
jgi:adenine-specific DNA-methyltransferase